MPRISLAGFKDPVRRPRYIIWTSVIVLILAAVIVTALAATSTYWFCANACHKVQDDTITAYNRSSHSRVACMACHSNVKSNIIPFVLHKAESLGELYLTVTGNYELPLNGESHVALTMTSGQCTQCHNLDTRPVTPSAGILIDHDVHAENDVTCTTCHNRVAHREDFELALKNPNGEPNTKHTDFMSMTSCFRCHSQNASSGELSAPGACAACHPSDFDLKPASHKAADFYPKGHAVLAQAEYSRVASLTAEGTETAEHSEEQSVGESLPPVSSINECSTCHAEKFCSDCHGLPMPHPADFMKGHGDLGKSNPKVCSTCHGPVDKFCDACHHGTSVAWELTSEPWRTQHPKAVGKTGASACFDCHNPTYCSACHVNGGTMP